jgi:ribosome biogenesis GTP-binding protein YsxC/EngB
MIIHNAEFICSNTSYLKCPDEMIPEYAFIGRSNVGKSSLINSLVNKKGMAKTSSTPGKTQLINHFLVNKEFNPWHLVDLPGYGYAEAPVERVIQWQDTTQDFLQHRRDIGVLKRLYIRRFWQIMQQKNLTRGIKLMLKNIYLSRMLLNKLQQSNHLK